MRKTVRTEGTIPRQALSHFSFLLSHLANLSPFSFLLSKMDIIHLLPDSVANQIAAG